MSDLRVVDYEWFPYNILKMEENLYKRQIEDLYVTDVQDLENEKPYTFLYLKSIERAEEIFKNLYMRLDEVDTPDSLWREALYSSMIEGADITRERAMQLYDGEYVSYGNKSEAMVKGCINVAREGVNVKYMRHTFLRQLWETLVHDCCENVEIAGNLYRSGDVRVGNHIPITSISVKASMSGWLAFYMSDELEDHPLIKAALLHFIFEHIHPYCDGNGRFGRYLMYRYLVERFPALSKTSISEEIYASRREYYFYLNCSENEENDATSIILYLLNVINRSIYGFIGGD